jgi:hypothetical protein
MDHINVLYSIQTLYLSEHAAPAYIYGILENEWPLKIIIIIYLNSRLT